MSRATTAIFLLLALAGAAFPRALVAAVEVPPGFAPLFNGTDLSGWWGLATEDPATWQGLPPDQLAAKKAASRADIRSHWRVDGSELVNDGTGLYLTSDADFGDVELRLEYKTVAQADSGVYLRGCPQVQIWDTTEAGGKWNLGADKGSGGLWNNAPGAPGKDPLVKADKPFGEWNQLRVIMVGERVTVWLNGQLTVDHARLENYFARQLPLPRRGPIQLQTHGGEIRWRNVIVRPLGGDEALAILRAHGPERALHDALPAVFNGTDFTGWAGPVENYEIVDGAIQCKPGKGGTIYTTAVYADFRAHVEFRLPPAGNNGLAIRYPGEGDTAYVGMCELQVLDSEDPGYAKLDARQFHGSAYGLAAASRGYLNPLGQWNYEEVAVIGSTIRVELNGTRILDTDLAKILPPYLDDKQHPGKERTEGHFGFAGHNDPVAFRNVAVQAITH
ncbi:MAG: DUF1080 domain-containing protein [Planctomycetes bacterium]|nr:DUF1080 domain-containing protein [Planctomycetota bacterium]